MAKVLVSGPARPAKPTRTYISPPRIEQVRFGLLAKGGDIELAREASCYFHPIPALTFGQIEKALIKAGITPADAIMLAHGQLVKVLYNRPVNPQEAATYETRKAAFDLEYETNMKKYKFEKASYDLVVAQRKLMKLQEQQTEKKEDNV